MSFNYAFNTELMTQLRGGAGLFVTNQPGVWLGNIFSNSGMTQVQYNCGPTQSAALQHQSAGVQSGSA